MKSNEPNLKSNELNLKSNEQNLKSNEQNFKLNNPNFKSNDPNFAKISNTNFILVVMSVGERTMLVTLKQILELKQFARKLPRFAVLHEVRVIYDRFKAHTTLVLDLCLVLSVS